MSAVCATCDNVTPRTRDYDGWRWRCMASPIPDIVHHLGPGVRATEPYGRCLDHNRDGTCKDWQPRREKNS